MNDTLSHMLRTLRLSGLAETLEVRLHEASANRLSHTEFLELILQDEMLVRDQRKIARRVKSASFRDLKSLEEFDWNFNPSIKKSQIYELASGQFIKERRDVLLCSAPGTGKSHLIQGIGYHLIKQGYVVWYRRVQSCRKAVNGNRSLPLVAAGHWGADNACTLSDWKTGDY
jgi:DNA replication protein DnaC